MNRYIRFLLVPALLGWLVTGCTERIEPKPLTYSRLLTGTEKKAWRLVSYQEFDVGQGSPVLRIQQEFDPCRADDQYVFYANDERKFEYDNGPTKCGANEPQVFFDDSWSLVNANATLEFVIPIWVPAKIPFVVKNLTENVLTVEYYEQDLELSYRFTFNASTR